MTEILNTVPDNDQGSEAIRGFDYQAHCIARLCLDMVSDPAILETVCECHEDVLQVRSGLPLRLCQIKKRESARSWPISLVSDAIYKLLLKACYKDVGELVIYGHGSPSKGAAPSLAGLVTLLDRPTAERGGAWDTELQVYEDHFAGVFAGKISRAAIEKALRLLKIRLEMPHPDGIESANKVFAAQVIQGVWDRDVATTAATKAYEALFKKVLDASRRPQRTRMDKTITRQDATAILRSVLEGDKFLYEATEKVMDTQMKLRRGHLENRLPYALEMRLHAVQVRHELGLTRPDWEGLRTQVAVRWEEFQNASPGLSGATLLQGLHNVLAALGNEWSVTDSGQMDAQFAEGVFFDMMAVCFADIRAS